MRSKRKMETVRIRTQCNIFKEIFKEEFQVAYQKVYEKLKNKK